MKKIFQKAIVALYFVLALASCSQEVKHQVLELKEYDSISIAINYPYLSNYPHLTPCVREGELYVVGYNYFEHYFDYYPYYTSIQPLLTQTLQDIFLYHASLRLF